MSGSVSESWGGARERPGRSEPAVWQRSWGVRGDGKLSVCGGGGASWPQQGQRPLERWSREWQPVGASVVG